MYNWAGAISNPVINSEPLVFCHFKVCSPFQDKNQTRIPLKDITLRVLSREKQHWQQFGHWLIPSLSEFKLMNSHTYVQHKLFHFQVPLS